MNRTPARKQCSLPGCRKRRMAEMMYCEEHLGLTPVPEPPYSDERAEAHARWLRKVLPVMGKEDDKR